MKKSPHPQWALKHKIKGSELRKIGNYYYLYEVSSKWNPEKKRSQKITGRLLGKITKEDGFIESDKEKLRKQRMKIEKVQTKEYGFSCLLKDFLSTYVVLLKKHFPEQWQIIIALTYGRLLYQAPLKNIGFHFFHSYLSEEYFPTDLSGKALGGFLKELGYKRDKLVDFFREFSKANDCILFDGTDIPSESRKMSLCELGKSKKGIYQPLINSMFVFSVRLSIPIYYRILPGNIKDVKSFKLCLKESGVKDATIIVDKGFCSEQNIKELDEAKLKYIIPLRRDSSLIDYNVIRTSNKEKFEGYFKFEGRYIWFYSIKYENNKNVYVYLDEELKMDEQKDYLARIEKKVENYSLEKFYEKQHTFGSIALYLNNAKINNPEKTYSLYKSRTEVENMIDVLKNIVEADKTYMQNEQTLEGWMFINYIALHWYYKVYKLLLENDLLKKYAVMDFFKMISEIRIVKINNQWHKAETIQKTVDLMNKLNIHIT
ncbi:MAG: Transposase DDE domain protein [Bacteroidetes bacterium ADurb.Bin408]|nr:MAG: Transposase DDE domain protein [Bacteroidetes bacterium ADurb.Bin408]